MGEPRRVDPTAAGAPDAASQADTLLVQGLDRYFTGRYEDAIHIWTRVLFLDRAHPRARAYIDRARTAIAERQRKADELLQASQQLLDRGDTAAARDLLTEAVASTGDDEHAAAVRDRLERVERATRSAVPDALPIRAADDIVPEWAWPRRTPALTPTAFLIAVAAIALVVGLASIGMSDWFGATSVEQALGAPAVPAKMPVLSSSDVAIIRARMLYGRGRLAEALLALDRVEDHSAVRAEADALRIEIQRLLLASGGEKR